MSMVTDWFDSISTVGTIGVLGHRDLCWGYSLIARSFSQFEGGIVLAKQSSLDLGLKALGAK